MRSDDLEQQQLQLISGLSPFTSFNVTVVAYNNVGQGKPNSIMVTTNPSGESSAEFSAMLTITSNISEKRVRAPQAVSFITVLLNLKSLSPRRHIRLDHDRSISLCPGLFFWAFPRKVMPQCISLSPPSYAMLLWGVFRLSFMTQ